MRGGNLVLRWDVRRCTEGDLVSHRQIRVSVQGFGFLLALALLVGVLGLVLYLGGPYYD